MRKFSLAGVVAALLWATAAQAGSFPPPTLVLSTPGTDTTFSLSGPAQLQDDVFFAGVVNQNGVHLPIPNGGTVVTSGQASNSQTFTDSTTINQYVMTGNAGQTQGIIRNYAHSSAGEDAFVNTGVRADSWYILHGPGIPTGTTETLSADVLFQGTLTGSGLGQGVFFNGRLKVVSHPGATTGLIPLGIDAHLNSPGVPFQIYNNGQTIPDIQSYSNITINDVVRSNPFQVQVGVPFELGMALSAAATTSSQLGGAGITSDSNFTDPGLTSLFAPQGFLVQNPSDPNTTLAQNGLVLQAAVPEPSTLILLSLGLGGLGVAGWRKRVQIA